MKAIIAAAGTGGHINPGIAIANKIKEEEPNSKIIFIGTNRGLENDLVPRAGYELETINAYGIERKLTFSNFKRLFHTINSIREAKKIIHKFKPDVVIGTGGYICLPVMIAAHRLNIPIIIHESNAFPGVAVKILSKKANTVLVGFKEGKERLPNAKKIVVTGTPTKVQKLELKAEEQLRIKKELGVNDSKPIVLVFGGSQGAQSINNSLISIISNKKNKDYQIIWAAGPLQYDNIKEELAEKGLNIDTLNNVKIMPYIYNMEEVMNVVDLVVCRSGAMTITEIANVGKPAIFIPFPYATENHQEYNAKVLEKVNAAKIILDKDLTAEKLQDTIQEIIKSKTTLEEMSKNAAKISVKDVENQIYQEIKKVIK